MTSLVPDTVLDELLGRGLTHKQWRLILLGEIFNGSIGGRYYTEWQHTFGCRSFRYNGATQQRLIEREFELFRGEIEIMVLEGYSFKNIARRLRGECWIKDGMEERDEKDKRLKMRRLFGKDARSCVFKRAVKKWEIETPPGGSIKLSQVRNRNHDQSFLLPRLKNLDMAFSQDPHKPTRIPENFMTNYRGQSFRCSFSAVGGLAPQNEVQPPDHARTCWMNHESEMSLRQAIFNLKVGNQQSEEELRAIKADLMSIKSRLEEQEAEIATLQEGRGRAEGRTGIVDEFEEMFWQKGEYQGERCHSRRRGRVFHCEKIDDTSRPTSRHPTKIPVRVASLTTKELIARESASRSMSMTMHRSRLPVPANMQHSTSEKVQRHRRGMNPNRDSGYASPSSNYGSSESMLGMYTHLDVVGECAENGE